MKYFLSFIIISIISYHNSLAQKLPKTKKLFVKEYNIYGQLGVIQCANAEKLAAKLSPVFTLGINKVAFPVITNQYSLYLKLGLEYNYIYYYCNLHYSNGNFGIAPPSINVSQITHHQITIPVNYNLGIIEGHQQFVGSIGLYGSLVFGMQEQFVDSGITKSVKVGDYNHLNFGIQAMLGMDRLFNEKEMFQPFSSVYIGFRKSFLGIVVNGNYCQPIEIFTHICLE